MPQPDAAVAIVHAVASDSVLLMRRAERESDPWSGHWSFPGGRRDAADKDLLETALRELAEECGITLAAESFESRLPDAIARRSTGRYLQVAPFVFQVSDETEAVPDLVEAIEAVWVPLQILRDPPRHVMSTVAGRPAAMLFPAVILNGCPLWGFTYRMITEWLGLLPADREEASFAAASRMLAKLMARGNRLARDWKHEQGHVRAAVHGVIPAESLLLEAGGTHSKIPSLNMLEIRADLIRMIGLNFEEYVIQAMA